MGLLQRKPLLIPTVFTICAFITLICLGTWQVQRLQWKTALIESIAEKDAKPFYLLPKSIHNVDDILYDKVWIEGEFLHDKEVHVYSGEKKWGTEAGYHVLTPLKRFDNGEWVLIDRGWVPTSKKERDTRPETLIKGLQRIEGRLFKGEEKRWFFPDNDVKNNLWIWLDIPAMEQFTGKTLAPVIIVAGKGETGADPKKLPVPQEATIDLFNNHLEYVVTWYGLAVVLLVVYGVYYRKIRSTVA